MISYNGKTELKNKINNIIDEMLNDKDFVYIIQIKENRIDEKIEQFIFEVADIRNSMPDF